jgi:hypothetical protein
LGDRRSDGESSCNSGDGTGQMAQPWMFMVMMMIFLSVVEKLIKYFGFIVVYSVFFKAYRRALESA